MDTPPPFERNAPNGIQRKEAPLPIQKAFASHIADNVFNDPAPDYTDRKVDEKRLVTTVISRYSDTKNPDHIERTYYKIAHHLPTTDESDEIKESDVIKFTPSETLFLSSNPTTNNIERAIIDFAGESEEEYRSTSKIDFGIHPHLRIIRNVATGPLLATEHSDLTFHIHYRETPVYFTVMLPTGEYFDFKSENKPNPFQVHGGEVVQELGAFKTVLKTVDNKIVIEVFRKTQTEEEDPVLCHRITGPATLDPALLQDGLTELFDARTGVDYLNGGYQMDYRWRFLDQKAFLQSLGITFETNLDLTPEKLRQMSDIERERINKLLSDTAGSNTQQEE